jgi:hypothetical protein
LLDKIEVGGIESDPDGGATEDSHLSAVDIGKQRDIIFFMYILMMVMVVFVKLIVDAVVSMSLNLVENTAEKENEQGFHGLRIKEKISGKVYYKVLIYQFNQMQFISDPKNAN